MKGAAQLALLLTVGVLAAAFFLRPDAERLRSNMGVALEHEGEFRDYLLGTSYTARKDGAFVAQCWGVLRVSVCTEAEGQTHRESF